MTYEELLNIIKNYKNGILTHQDERIINNLHEDFGFSCEYIKCLLDYCVGFNPRLNLRYVEHVALHLYKEGIRKEEQLILYLKCKNSKESCNDKKRREPVITVPLKPDMSMMRFDIAELIQCPFCGNKKVGIKCQFSSKHDAFYMMAECNCCGANTRAILNTGENNPNLDSFWNTPAVEQVVELWNSRV